MICTNPLKDLKILNPFVSPISSIFDNIEKNMLMNLENFLKDFDMKSNHFEPKYNIIDETEKDRGWVIEMFLPGFSKDNIELYQEENYLKILGNPRKTEESEKYVYKSYTPMKFEKVFKLHDKYQVTSAVYSDGVLKITIDLPEEEKRKEKRKTIEISS
ncbi:MAG: Hsp20/alpha crystallin family protein [Candidatus Aenigmatarchaeota archaeon]